MGDVDGLPINKKLWIDLAVDRTPQWAVTEGWKIIDISRGQINLDLVRLGNVAVHAFAKDLGSRIERSWGEQSGNVSIVSALICPRTLLCNCIGERV